MAEVQTAPPLAKYLASTEKKVRDKSVKQLTAFLSNTDNVLPKKDMDKLWKGIFYCFWMSDKPLVQQALATELAEIILAITSPASSLAFLRGFWEATVREWTGIDRLRIDKYYMLVRRFVNASFRLLIREKWEESLCEEYNSILTQRGGPLCTNNQRVPAGLIFHLSDIYIEELDKALGSTDSPQPAPLLTILSPFISLAAQASTSVAYKRIQSALFEPILESLSVPAEEAEDSEEPKTKRRRTEDEAMFPHLRANVCIERHQRTDALSIKKKLLRAIFDVASQPESRDANRRKMYALWKEGSDDVEDDDFLSLATMLPLDVCIDVLSLLPVGDVGVKTLVACLETTKLLRETAQIPSVWKSQYEHRYSNCDRRREDERRTALKNNWYLMFLERAKLDNVARDLLVQLVEDRQNLRRYGAGVTMIKFGMDVWDVLHLESRRPRPNAFRPLDEAEDTPQPEHSLTRTFWAKSCLEMISRAEAIDIWRDVMSAGKSDARTFERAISSLSCFLGYREGMMTERLDSLAAGFVEHAKATRLDIDPESGGYDLQQVCREICDFMHSEGFHVPRNDQSFVHVMNSFPHYFLTDKRETIPLSLMYAFTSIANRIGIDAYPVNFPGVVMGYVRPQDPNQEPLAINVATTNSSHSVGRVGSDAMPIFLTAAGFNFVPCDSKDMLLRAARNILAALMNSRPSSQIVYHSTLLLSGCIHLLLGGIDEIMPVRFIANMNIWTLDAVVLLNYLSPLLHSGRRLMENVCWEVINKKQQPLGREGRTVKYFVGMPFVHAKFSYTGFIYNWDDECNAEEAWIAQMQVNTLTRGRHQPFYNAFSEDGSQRYVAEENIIPASYGRTHVTKILEKFDNFPLYFDDVDYPSGTDVTTRQGRGRLLLSPQSKSDYPDDDAYGAAWVEHGFAQ